MAIQPRSGLVGFNLQANLSQRSIKSTQTQEEEEAFSIWCIEQIRDSDVYYASGQTGNRQIIYTDLAAAVSI
jgi:hypothetical protein